MAVSLRSLAISRAVLLLLLLSLAAAKENLPESLINFAASSCPFSAMIWRAVRPELLVALTTSAVHRSLPNRAATIPSVGQAAARCKAV